MKPPETSRQRQRNSELRSALVFAGSMLAVLGVAKLAAQSGWGDVDDLRKRALMILVAAYIVATGNTIPKRLGSIACQNADPSQMQAFCRFAGWTWVLTGLALGMTWVLLPGIAETMTLVIMPAGIALIGIRWFLLYSAGREAT